MAIKSEKLLPYKKEIISSSTTGAVTDYETFDEIIDVVTMLETSLVYT